MVERIVVGIDGSGPSRAALHWALNRSAASGAQFVLEHVVDDQRDGFDEHHARTALIDGELALGQAVDQSRAFKSGIAVESRLVHGRPVSRLASEVQPGDLLAVGSHKTGFLRGRVLGTRSLAVVAAAPCSVVVIPDDRLTTRRGVIVGVASGAASRAAIVAGATEAQRLGQDLSLVHGSVDSPEAAALARTLLAEAAELAATTAPGLTIRSRVSRRSAAEALLDASHTASLLVLGSNRIDEDERAGFIGSLTHEVLLNLNSPVLVARPVSEPVAARAVPVDAVLTP